MLIFLVNVLPVERVTEPLASVWSRNFVVFCLQAWLLANAQRLSAHLTEMLKTYLRDNREAYILPKTVYPMLNPHDGYNFHGVVNPRFDPWHNRN